MMINIVDVNGLVQKRTTVDSLSVLYDQCVAQLANEFSGVYDFDFQDIKVLNTVQSLFDDPAMHSVSEIPLRTLEQIATLCDHILSSLAVDDDLINLAGQHLQVINQTIIQLNK